jgi:hypothetical protein
MLDTLKLSIPLTRSQHRKLLLTTQEAERWQWVLFHPKTGEMRQRKVEGLAQVNGESYHRELRWSITPEWSSESRLILEFSVPKYWYGHNIHLLYDVLAALNHFKREFESQFGLRHNRLSPVLDWEVDRADVCYAWRMPSQDICHLFLNSLKHLHFPRKKPVIHDTSIFFSGGTFSLKAYEKLPEFRAHDLREMVKAGLSLEYINELEAKATGVLRIEATLRKQYLRKHAIKTVADLLIPVFRMEPDQELCKAAGDNPDLAMDGLWTIYLANHELEGCDEVELWRHFECPRKIEATSGTSTFDGASGQDYKYSVGSFTVRTVATHTMILETMMNRLLGENRQMQTVDQVEAMLREAYSLHKAARLVSVWLYAQRLGTARAKEAFGANSYYYSKREMKKAGVSLIDLPENVSPIDRDFYASYRMQVPSPYVTNLADDFRDHDNVVNLQQRRLAAGQ